MCGCGPEKTSMLLKTAFKFSRRIRRDRAFRCFPVVQERSGAIEGADQRLYYSSNPVEAASGRTDFVPRRAVLYVPADDPKKVSKISGLDIDCPVLECEDGVSANRKAAAREGALCALSSAPWVQERKKHNKDVAVRINSVASGLAEEDLRTVLSGETRPTTLLIPKTDTVDDIDWISSHLQKHGRSTNGDILRLILYVETAKAVVSLKKILRRALELGDKRDLFQVDGVVFGSDDYCADIGATRTKDATEVLFARQHFVTIIKSFQRSIQAIDLVHIDYKDLDDLKRQAEEGAQFGFTGKQIIHPTQAPIVQTAFSPSPSKIQWAEELVAAFDKHQNEGKFCDLSGAFTFRNSMIDRPLLLQAQNVLRLNQLLRVDVRK